MGAQVFEAPAGRRQHDRQPAADEAGQNLLVSREASGVPIAPSRGTASPLMKFS